jgi:hypothetical protein
MSESESAKPALGELRNQQRDRSMVSPLILSPANDDFANCSVCMRYATRYGDVRSSEDIDLLAAAANAKPIIVAPKAPPQPTEQTTKGTALTPAELALRMAQFDSEYAKDRRDLPFKLTMNDSDSGKK